MHGIQAERRNGRRTQEQLAPGCELRAGLAGVLVLLSVLGCSPGGEAGLLARPILEEASGADLRSSPRVARLKLYGADEIPLDALWMISGELSSTSEGRIVRGDVPDTISDRRLKLAVWIESEAQVLAPLEVLEPGETYTVLAIGVGELGRLTTDEDAPDLWHRWGEGPHRIGSELLYCRVQPPWALLEGGDKGTGKASETQLEGFLMRPGLAEGVLQDDCLRLVIPDNGLDWLVPPQGYAGRFFAPEVIPIIEAEAVQTESKREDQRGPSAERIGEAVVAVANGLFTISQPGAPTVLFEALERTELLLPRGGTAAPLILSFTQGSGGSVLDASWLKEDESQRIVITEVLADPLGAEPGQEWVELWNPGTEAVNLQGYELSDSSGHITLPKAILKGGSYAVVVTEAYRADPLLEPIPASNAVPVIVEKLGKSGLTNGGEILTLAAPDGTIVSRVPRAPGGPGVSLARRHPLYPDGPSAFEPHGGDGASPGSANEFDSSRLGPSSTD